MSRGSLDDGIGMIGEEEVTGLEVDGVVGGEEEAIGSLGGDGAIIEEAEVRDGHASNGFALDIPTKPPQRTLDPDPTRQCRSHRLRLLLRTLPRTSQSIRTRYSVRYLLSHRITIRG